MIDLVFEFYKDILPVFLLTIVILICSGGLLLLALNFEVDILFDSKLVALGKGAAKLILWGCALAMVFVAYPMKDIIGEYWTMLVILLFTLSIIVLLYSFYFMIIFLIRSRIKNV